MGRDSPYLLPDGNVQIAFSGGRTSAFMLHQILEANGGIPEDRCEVTFQNTGRESNFTRLAGRSGKGENHGGTRTHCPRD